MAISEKQKGWGIGGVFAALIGAGSAFGINLDEKVASLSKSHQVDYRLVVDRLSENQRKSYENYVDLLKNIQTGNDRIYDILVKVKP